MKLTDSIGANETNKPFEPNQVKDFVKRSIQETIQDHLAAKESGRRQELDRMKNLASSIQQEIADRLAAMNRASSVQQEIELADRLMAMNRASSIQKELSQGIASFNLSPNVSASALLASINYPTSSMAAISKDWQNVGKDLWRSHAVIKGEHE